MDPLLPLFIDDRLIAINKPAGLSAVPGGWNQPEPSLFSILTGTYGKIWIVHRLDKFTSGVILFARTAEIHRTLSLLFETRGVHKLYHAIVVGVPAWQTESAHHSLRENIGHRHRTVIDPSRGKPSLTHFRVLERYSDYALLSASPETGRTHQVRAHASALGFPLVSDLLYSAPPGNALLSRSALHAWQVEFTLSGQPFSLSAPYPPDFQSALEKLRASG